MLISALFSLIVLSWAASCVPNSIEGWKTFVSYEIRILRFGEGEIVTKNTRPFIGSCRNVDFAAVGNARSYHPSVKS